MFLRYFTSVLKDSRNLKGLVCCANSQSIADFRAERTCCSRSPANRMEFGSSSELRFVEKISQLVLQKSILTGHSGAPSDKILEFLHPAELQAQVDLSLGDPVDNEDKLLELCETALKYSVHTNHPHFYNQLYHGADPVGVAASWLTDALNTNQHTFEVAPFFTLVEHAVLAHMRSFIGWQDGDGIFSPGGSISNMYGMVLARYRKCPETKTKGLAAAGQLVAFTSDESHYSVTKSAHWLGIGTDNVVKVPTDTSGRMKPEALEAAVQKSIAEGKEPFFVNATSGTTVLGAYDPLDPLADLCQQYGLWLHVDACWGGAVLVSEKHRYLMDGIERVDSVAWNPHKMLGAPLQCAAFLVKHKGLMHQANSASASYLFQQDKFYDVSFDTGDKSIQCGRKVDAFKLWIMWKARGDRGFQHLVDNAFDCARYFAEVISGRPGFRLVIPEVNCTNVCFWYIPPRLRNQEESPEWWKQIEQVGPAIKKRMAETGTLMIGYQPLPHRNLVNFLRLVLPAQPLPTHADMHFIADEIERLGKDL